MASELDRRPLSKLAVLPVLMVVGAASLIQEPAAGALTVEPSIWKG